MNKEKLTSELLKLEYEVTMAALRGEQMVVGDKYHDKRIRMQFIRELLGIS